MHITLCTGLFRSGSTWSYNVCRELAKLAGDKNNSTVAFPIFDNHLPIDEYIKENISSDGYSCIKVHMPGPEAMKQIQKGAVYNVCTYRDPRDCIVSYYQFKKLPAKHCINILLKNLHNIDFYYETGNTLFVPYEGLVDNPLQEIMTIAGHLDISINKDQAENIASLTSLKRMQEIQQSLKKEKKPGEAAIDESTRIFDNHIQSSQAGRWKSVLSTRDSEVLTNIFRKWIDRWGYDPQVK